MIFFEIKWRTAYLDLRVPSEVTNEVNEPNVRIHCSEGFYWFYRNDPPPGLVVRKAVFKIVRYPVRMCTVWILYLKEQG